MMHGDAEDPLAPGPAGGATCVRVPVDVGHSVQVAVETERELGAGGRARRWRVPGDPLAADAAAFPTPLDAAGRDEVFVGRSAPTRTCRACCTSGWWRTTCARAPRPTRCRSSRAAWLSRAAAAGGRARADRDQRRRRDLPLARRRARAADPRPYKHWGFPKGHVEGARPRRRRAARGGGGDGARAPGARAPAADHRLVLPLPRAADPQVLPLLPDRVAGRGDDAAGGRGDHRVPLAPAAGGDPR
jgi:hypothetical protein